MEVTNKKIKKIMKNGNQKEAYKAFLNLLSDEDKKLIKSIDRLADKIIVDIVDESGWSFDESVGFSLQNDLNDIYMVLLHKEGFRAFHDEANDKYTTYLKNGELQFINQYEKSLEYLHYLLSNKQSIISSSYETFDGKDRDKAETLGKMLDCEKTIKKSKI